MTVSIESGDLMPKFDIVPGLKFVSRESWKPNNKHPRLGKKVARSNRTHVIVHHTVGTDKGDTSPNIWENEKEIFSTMRNLQTSRPDLGLDVPYNFVAFLTPLNDGLYVCEGRGEDRTGAHTKGHNTRGIAVSFAGNFHEKKIDPVDIARRMPFLSMFLGWLRFSASHPDYGNFTPMRKLDSVQPNGRHVFIHRDFKNTACPGKKLVDHLGQVDFVNPNA